MSVRRIFGILRQELYITTRSVETINDVFIFQFIQVVLFGIFALFLIGSKVSIAAHYLLLGIILWQILSIVQYSISVGALWNIWARNLSNMFISPLTPQEYLIGFTSSGILKAILVFSISGFIAQIFFGFSVFQIGILNLTLCFINLAFFGVSLGLIIMGMIFKYGTRIQAFAWSIIPILQPLSAAFYPVKILPPFLRDFAYILPSTYVFEAARSNLNNLNPAWNLQLTSFGENIIYFVIGIWIFQLFFKSSKKTGQFTRNES